MGRCGPPHAVDWVGAPCDSGVDWPCRLACVRYSRQGTVTAVQPPVANSDRGLVRSPFPYRRSVGRCFGTTICRVVRGGELPVVTAGLESRGGATPFTLRAWPSAYGGEAGEVIQYTVLTRAQRAAQGAPLLDGGVAATSSPTLDTHGPRWRGRGRMRRCRWQPCMQARPRAFGGRTSTPTSTTRRRARRASRAAGKPAARRGGAGRGAGW